MYDLEGKNADLKLRQHEYPGFYVLFEGQNGTGKSTLVARVQQTLNDEASEAQTRERDGKSGIFIPVAIQTAEPMHSLYGGIVRKRMVNAKPEEKLELGFAFAADRQYHQNTVVIPALRSGKIVIQDRGALSTLVYQTEVFGEYVDVLNLGVIAPDLVVLLSCTEEDYRLRRGLGNDVYERRPFNEVSDQFSHTLALMYGVTHEIPHFMLSNSSLHDEDTLTRHIVNRIKHLRSNREPRV